MAKGEMAPFDGTLLTHPLAAALQASLDEAVAKTDEQKRFCRENLSIQDAGNSAAIKVIESSCKEREAALKSALKASQEQAQQAAEETAAEQVMHGVWFGGGLAVGILVGAVVAAGLVLYFGDVTASLP